MNQTKIRLISCYFGKLPPYIELVLKSMACNPSIDWLIVTDDNRPLDLPPNVAIRHETPESLAALLSTYTGQKAVITSLYDFTRLKPLFGRCFPEEFRGYGFWGHIDLDMIFGDLRKFITEKVLAEYDRIFSRGHLCLFRNVPRVHDAILLPAPGAVHYQDVLSGKNTMPFDEWDGIWKIFRYHQLPQYHDECIADIRPPTAKIARRFEAYELTNHPEQVFYWYRGKVYQSYYHREGGIFDREVAYIHFQKRSLPAPDFDVSDTNGFTIGPLGFARYEMENLSRSEMRALNPERKVSIYTIWKGRLAKRLAPVIKNIRQVMK
jgi:hypothetical protein